VVVYEHKLLSIANLQFMISFVDEMKRSESEKWKFDTLHVALKVEVDVE